MSKKTFFLPLIASVLFFSAHTSIGAETSSPDLRISKPKTVSVNPDTMMIEVIDPFVEMRTGPGRGYPVFNSIEQGETVEVLKRKPDWYLIRTQKGKTGWTSDKQLARTLTTSGIPVKLPTVSYGEYLQSKWRVGFTTGQFISGDLEGAETLSINAAYRYNDWLGLEAAAGTFQNPDLSGKFYGFNGFIEPRPDWPLPPFLVLGLGEISVDSQPIQAQLNIDQSNYSKIGLGVSFYLGSNFAFRSEYRWYTIDTDTGDSKVREWQIGFNTFF